MSDGLLDENATLAYVNRTTPEGEWKEIAMETVEMGQPFIMCTLSSHLESHLLYRMKFIS